MDNLLLETDSRIWKVLKNKKRFIEVNNIAGIITEKLSHKFRQSTMEFYLMTKEKNKMHSSGCEIHKSAQ